MANLQLALFLTVVLQVAELPKLGNFGRTLSAQDIAAIERDALPAGSRAWLLVGPYGQQANSIEAYLQPEVSSAEVRRGTVAIVRRQPGGSWSAVRNGTWAQVALTGRNFDAIQGEQDLNRPFMIEGKFDDAELISLVRFLRGSTAVERTWPTSYVYRQPDGSIRVFLRPETGTHFQIVILRKQGMDWVVVSAQKAVA